MAASSGDRNVIIPDKNSLLEHIFIEALKNNYCSVEKWTTWKEEHVKLKKTLQDFPNKLSHQGVIPFGSRALVKANIIHTNEIMSCIGDGYFIKQSAKQAMDMCDRRIKDSEKMLEDLEKERKLFQNRQTLPKVEEAFASGDQEEIVEEYDEEKEKQWRAHHREMVKKHCQELAELRKKSDEGGSETEEDLFRRLDLLELEEEMNDELDRLNDVTDSDESDGGSDEESEIEEKDEKQDSQEKDIGKSNSQIAGTASDNPPSSAIQSIETNFKGFQKVMANSPCLEPGQVVYGFTDKKGNEWQKPVITNTSEEENPVATSLRKSRKSVSFASEGDDSDTEANQEIDPNIIIRFKHSDNNYREPPENQMTESGDVIHINSPRDIYRQFANCMSSAGPKSILKKSSYEGEDSMCTSMSPSTQNLGSSVRLKSQDSADSFQDLTQPARNLSHLPPVLRNVMEINDSQPLSSQSQPMESGRRVSRFKASRAASQGHT